MDQHKKVLGIIYIATACLQIIVFSLLSAFFSTIFSFAMKEVSPEDAWILELIFNLAKILPWLVIIFISLPSLIAGIGLLYQQQWAMIMVLILGCLKLFSFPIGTAIGIYTIWVYVESGKRKEESRP